MRPPFHAGLAMLVFVTMLVLCPAAQAWQNGSAARSVGGPTVQQWILTQAVSEAVQSGTGWVDLSSALPTVGLPDTVAHDVRYHDYVPRNGGHVGAAPERTAVYFELVRDALQAGDTATASRLLGMLTFYYTDAVNPLHTGACRSERRMHRRFELRVMALLNSDSRFERSVCAALAGSDTAESATASARAAGAAQNVAAFTAASSARAHRFYRSLVRTYLRHGFSRIASRIAATTLERSVHGVATLIEAAAQPAAVPTPPSSGSPVLLSSGCEPAASSQDLLFHAARFADDGDDSSAWVSADSAYPQWWQVDLGATRDLDSVTIDWPAGATRSYTYDIKVSDDGTTWQEVVDQSSRIAFGGSAETLSGVCARYVRVDVLGYSVSSKAHEDSADAAPAAILECRVYGDATPSPDPTPTATPEPTPSATATGTPSPSPDPTTDPTPSSTPTPTPTPTSTPGQSTVTVPAAATKAQIDACVTSAVKDGSGTWIVFPAGTFAYSGTFIVPDGINVRGQGIWDQGSSSGGGGTWLQASKGMQWGSHSTIDDLLVGENTAGLTCTFHPVARGSSAAGADTQTNGSHDVTFNFVRFKGGSDAGAALIDLSANYSNCWSATVKREDMVDTAFNDCEFERPQITNTAAGTSLGAILNIWWDVRPGGAQVHDLTFCRCHFGVKNGYHSGVDDYGSGRTILLQGAPASSDSTGPAIGGNSVITGANWNPDFDWGQVDHGCYNVVFQDCLFEYSLWYPMDVCDTARAYSCWQGVEAGATDGGASIGWGNPPGSHWTSIPTKDWTDNLDITRCYFKGSYPTAHSIVYEIGRNSNVVDSFNGSGSFADHAGSYGNTVSGSFSNATRPHTGLFTSDWTGATTSYTASPNDP